MMNQKSVWFLAQSVIYFGMCLCEYFKRFKLLKQRSDIWN